MPDNDDDQMHDQAKQHLESRRDFGAHVVVFVVLNAALVVVWAATGAGYFWPVWVILGTGLALAFEAYSVFFQRDITDADVQREVDRRQGSGSGGSSGSTS